MTTQAATPWEQAYLRFETPAQEVRKFARRLRELGADQWDRQSAVGELFCGRGNGLHALNQLGFGHLEGVDLSATLAAQYTGPGTVHVGDCRHLPFADASLDIVVIQGGLHHLPSMPEDLALVLEQVRRVLRPGGRLILVEPHLTPFLHLVHAAAAQPLLRKCWRKLDALAIMIEHERTTYEQWLSQPALVLELLHRSFRQEQCRIAWGKLMFAGRRP